MRKLAFSIPTANLAEQKELFGGFRNAGFGGLQLKAGQYLRYLQAPQRFQEEWGVDAGAVSGLIWGGTLDDDAAELRRVLAFAAAIGAERVIFCHGRNRTGLAAADLRAIAEQLSDIAVDARARSGVALSLHHHFDQPVMHPAEMATFFDAAPAGAVGLTVDTAHLWKSGVRDVAAVIRDFRAHVDNVHLKDFSKGAFRTLGEGEIAFEPILEALRDVGYQGWLCADEESGASVSESLKISSEFLRRHTSTGQAPS